MSAFFTTALRSDIFPAERTSSRLSVVCRLREAAVRCTRTIPRARRISAPSAARWARAARARRQPADAIGSHESWERFHRLPRRAAACWDHARAQHAWWCYFLRFRLAAQTWQPTWIYTKVKRQI
jgi:hypothetical protein